MQLSDAYWTVTFNSPKLPIDEAKLSLLDTAIRENTALRES